MKLTPETAAGAVAKLALMAFFPSDADVRAALVSIFLEMIDTEEQLDWLVKRALQLYGRWPGIAEIRALYCSRWIPKDGMETSSAVYPEGIPYPCPECNPKGERPYALPRGHVITADADLDRQVRRAADTKKLAGRKKGAGSQPPVSP